MKNIALTGFMGTGKTAAGKILAKRLGMKYVDTDREIEKKTSMTINHIFSNLGEDAFRDIESEVIRDLSSLSNVVISTGGGAVLREENLLTLKKNCTVVCLTAKPETIISRVGGNKDRPLLNVPDPMQRIMELMAQRKPYYMKADVLIDTEGISPMQVAEEIIKNIEP